MKSVRMKRSLFLLFLAISSFFASAENNYSVFLEDVDAFPFIVVNKTDLTLHLIDQEGNTIRGYKISCAENYGNKERCGDHKTPEGFFKINQREIRIRSEGKSCLLLFRIIIIKV